MFVCLCKALTESDVASAAAACGQCPSTEQFIELLGLHCEEACGFCVDHPETVASIAHEVWGTASTVAAS